MDRLTMKLRKSDLDLACLGSIVNYCIQGPYDQGFLSNDNVTLGVSKLSFEESLFDVDRLTGESKKCPLQCPQENTVKLMTQAISIFCSLVGMFPDICLRTAPTAKDF